MNAIQSFQFNQQPIQVINKNGEAWFIAAEVAAVFGYRDAHNLTRVLDDDEADTHIMSIRSENGVEQDRTVSIINESGLYHAAFKSRKESVKQFRKWVTAEVLPTIRQTGRYELHLDRWLTEWEREQIRKAVKERCGRTGETSQAVYAKLHRFMDVPSYEQIGASQFQTALNFLASIQDAPEVSLRMEADMANLKNALWHGLFCAEFILYHHEALHGINRRLAAGIYDHAASACAAIRSVAERKAVVTLPGSSYFHYFPWDGDYHTKQRYRQLNPF